MKKTMLLITVCTLVYSICFATIRRVGYPGTFRANIDYASFQEAHDAASNNDTIQIYGSGYSGTVTKPLVILGFGYNFDANTGLQAIGTDAPSSVSINFGAGSDGGIVAGLSGTFTIGDVSNVTHTPVSNITFQRCNGSFQFYNAESFGPVSNIKIISCVVNSSGMPWSGINDFNVTNVQIYNSIVYQINMYKPGSTISFTNCVGSPVSFGLSLNDAGALVKNCIFPSSNSTTNTNTVYENNFFIEAQPTVLPPGSNNHWGQNQANLFTRNGQADDNASYYGYEQFDEDYYVLKAGSPAINGGVNAANQPTNCGIYGGDAAYVYKLSGVPAVPAIYQLTAPNLNASSNPYNVTISVRSNN